ncbi:MAG: hypothetical protein LBI49_08355 [Nocardiopsaceae bacterium]|nr:hypothetical protein [Nocardiopsaceae bacterium]
MTTLGTRLAAGSEPRSLGSVPIARVRGLAETAAAAAGELGDGGEFVRLRPGGQLAPAGDRRHERGIVELAAPGTGKPARELWPRRDQDVPAQAPGRHDPPVDEPLGDDTPVDEPPVTGLR